MKPTAEIASNPVTESDRITSSASVATAVTDFSYQQSRRAAPAGKAAPAKKTAELKTFRSLSRRVFGAEATREYIAEAILFGSIMAVAAWPLCVTLNQLGTMMIWLAPGGIW
jgi:hypothetical protein